MSDWYEKRHELLPDMVFTDYEGDKVKLVAQVPGDATQWYVAVWYAGWETLGHWSYEDTIIEPGDLREYLYTE